MPPPPRGNLNPSLKCQRLGDRFDGLVTISISDLNGSARDPLCPISLQCYFSKKN